MTATMLDEYKERLLAKLEAAAEAGLTLSGLGIKGAAKTGKLLRQALGELQREGRVGNLGLLTQPRYVLQRFYRPLDLAYEHVQAKAVPGKPHLYTRSELEKGLKGPMKGKLDEAMDLLVKERALLRLKRGNVSLYLHAASLAGLVPASVRPVGPGIDRDRLREAYRQAVRASGFSDVLVEEVQRRLDSSLEDLKALLIAECRAGRAVPSLGDWSLSSEAARTAAIDINGRPHLRIRLLD